MKTSRTEQTTMRLKLETFKVLDRLEKEKGLNRTEAVEYCVQVYDDFLQKQEENLKKQDKKR